MTDYVEESLKVIEEHRPLGYFERLKNNAYPTMSLFLEPGLMVRNNSDCEAGTLIDPIFTLKEHDYAYTGLTFKHKTYISMRKLYLAIADPTEYLFAKTVLGNYDHWKKFFKSDEADEVGRLVAPTRWFSGVLGWRVELELKLRAEGLQSIIDKTSNSSNAKWLVDRGWTTEGSLMGNSKAKRGRPSNAEVMQRADILSRVSADRSKVLSLRGKK